MVDLRLHSVQFELALSFDFYFFADVRLSDPIHDSNENLLNDGNQLESHWRLTNLTLANPTQNQVLQRLKEHAIINSELLKVLNKRLTLESDPIVQIVNGLPNKRLCSFRDQALIRSGRESIVDALDRSGELLFRHSVSLDVDSVAWQDEVRADLLAPELSEFW